VKRTSDDLCRKCGRCCRVKLIAEGEVFVLPESCPHLDLTTKLCRVYARRHSVNPDCADVKRGIAARVFPGDCPYVTGLEGYAPPIEVGCEQDIRDYLERDEQAEADLDE
jgi:uncharacterized protein